MEILKKMQYYSIVFFFLSMSVFAMASSYNVSMSSVKIYKELPSEVPSSQVPVRSASAGINIDETHEHEDGGEDLFFFESSFNSTLSKNVSKIYFKSDHYISPFLKQRSRPPSWLFSLKV